MVPKINYQDPQTPLESLMVAALRELKALGHPGRTYYGYTRVWNRLLQFAAERGVRRMSVQLGDKFLRALETAEGSPQCDQARLMAEARRSVRALLYFMLHGVWDPERAGRLHLMLPLIETTDPERASTPLESTIVSALRAMKSQGYRDPTCGRYSLIWRHLLKFAAERNIREMSAELHDEFLTAYRAAVTLPGPAMKTRMCMARRAMRSLLHFAAQGVWKPCHPLKDPPLLPRKFTNDLRVYLDYLRNERCTSPETLRSRKGYLQQFLVFLGSKRATDWPDVVTSHLTAFFATKTHLQPTSLEHVSGVLRGFLRFLFVTGRLEHDWYIHIPRFRSFADQRIPVTWPPGSVDALLRSVNRDCAQGKRDYAVLLLASRLGMRAGDIRSLRLESLRWEDARIEYAQSKTGNRATLPLTEEVGNAIIDYLLNGRPTSTHREVFLRVKAPHVPITSSLNDILKKYQQQLQTPLPPRRMSMHSLRHTLARQLLAIETPLETIAAVLGHVSLRATRMYTKVDLTQLRTAALDPEEVRHA